MKERGGFAALEGLLSAFAMTSFLVVATMISVQVARVVPRAAQARADARIAELNATLENLSALQSIWYADALAYSADERDLRFDAPEGVTISLMANGEGWAAVATHEDLGPDLGCAVFLGSVPAPTRPVRPLREGVPTCTE